MKKQKVKRRILLAALILLLLNLGNLGRMLYSVQYMDYIKQYAALYEVTPI